MSGMGTKAKKVEPSGRIPGTTVEVTLEVVMPTTVRFRCRRGSDGEVEILGVEPTPYNSLTVRGVTEAMHDEDHAELDKLVHAALAGGGDG